MLIVAEWEDLKTVSYTASWNVNEQIPSATSKKKYKHVHAL